MYIIPTEKVALFWDYENVPFQHRDWRLFVTALQQFIAHNTVILAKCYYRRQNMSEDDKENIQLIQHMKLKRVQGTAPNTVDNLLITSCNDTIHSHAEIEHVIIISGDGDFIPLLRDLQRHHIQTSVICHLQNGSVDLMNSHQFFPYHTLIENPETWWQHPESKLIIRRPNNKTYVFRYDKPPIIYDEFTPPRRTKHDSDEEKLKWEADNEN